MILKDAYKIVAPILVLAAIFALVRLPVITLISVLAAAFVCYFFRNPKRLIPQDPNLVVSPADGKVVKIASEDGNTLISIFLNIFDVHINRSPISGRVQSLQYRRGKFKPAFDDKASRLNEQNVITIAGADICVIVRQIAGLIARRVVCWKKPGDLIQRGELLGLIRFGSRVDIILPKEVHIRVKVGERVKGGATVLGEY